MAMLHCTPLPLAATTLILLACAGCAPSPSPVVPADERSEGRALVRFVAVSRDEAIVLEERLAPWPELEGDRDPGVRRLVRVTFGGARHLLFEADPDERLLDAARHPSGELELLGIDLSRRPFLVRLRSDGTQLGRWTLEDPDLAADTDAWLGDSPPDALRVGSLSGDGARIAADGEGSVVAVFTESNAVLVYRLGWNGTEPVRGPRTLVMPATTITPFLPIGGSYDVFDAIVNWFLVHLDVDPQGRAYVATFVNPNRLLRQNTVFGTSFEARKTDGDRSNRPSDFLLTRIDRDGSIGFATVGGAFDVDDETYAIRAGASSVAVVGRARRYRGLDNTEWDAHLAVFGTDGTERVSLTYDAVDSAIGQAVDFGPDGELYVGGTEAWAQNPDGFSLFDEGRPFLARLVGAELERLDAALPATRGHAELRDLRVHEGGLFLLGLEKGPLTHTGDADRALVVADGFLTVGPRER